MIDIPLYAPGCFGSAVAFSPKDLICSNCPVKAQCAVAHEETALVLAEKFGIARRRRAAPAAPPRDPRPVDLALPKPLRDLLDRLDRGNFDIVGKLGRGENPFDAALPYLRIACHLLLAVKARGLTINRDLLVTAFAAKLGCDQKTAKLNAAMAVYALTHVGAVSNVDGAIKLKETA